MILHYLTKHGIKIIASFSLKCITALPELNQLLLDFFYSVDLQLIHTAVD